MRSRQATALSARISMRATVGWADWSPLALLFMASLAMAAASSLRPRDPGRLAAVFPPWWSAGQSLDAASRVAAVTGFGGLPFVVAVSGVSPDLPRRLSAEGAWLVLDGSAFSFCASRQQGPSP